MPRRDGAVLGDIGSGWRRKILQAEFVRELGTLGVVVVAELEFARPARGWKFDWAIPSHRLAIELQGGIWIKGRHVRGAGFVKDREKVNEAVCRGWRVLELTYDDLASGQAVEWVRRTLTIVGSETRVWEC